MPSPTSRRLMTGLAAIAVLVGAGSGSWWYVHRPVAQHLTLYYADAQGMALVPIETTTDFERPDSPGPWAAALFDRLAHPPDPKLLPAVDARMSLIDASWMPPTWTLTVKLPSESGTTQETLLAGALVRSYVASFPGAQKVRLRLLGSDGKPFAAQHLDLSDALTPADFANQADAPPHTGLMATLWWRSKSGEELVPVNLPLSGGSGSPPHDAFERLLAGPPPEAGTFLAPIATPAIQAHWAGQAGDVATVDLDTVPSGPEAERFVKATILTLTEFSGVKAVRFTHGHANASGHVGVFDLAQPIPRPTNVNVAATTQGRSH